MHKENPFDWPLLLYAATVLLHKTEAEFWRMTPRQLQSLMDVHYEVNNGGRQKENKPKQGFIDQVM